MEWWWDQPDNAHVKAFVADMKKATGKNPTARNWFGYASVQSFALVANQEKTVDGLKLARALEGFKLPPEVALMPGESYFRPGDHELISPVFAGEAHAPEGDPDNMFTIRKVVPGDQAAGPVFETGCKLTWPS
jgi:branched-chain amino acid transport system substrate-binding protein